MVALHVLGQVHVKGGPAFALPLDAFTSVADLIQLAFAFPAAVLAHPSGPLSNCGASQSTHDAQNPGGERYPESYSGHGHPLILPWLAGAVTPVWLLVQRPAGGISRRSFAALTVSFGIVLICTLGSGILWSADTWRVRIVRRVPLVARY
jgi:hypothetical protein